MVLPTSLLYLQPIVPWGYRLLQQVFHYPTEIIALSIPSGSIVVYHGPDLSDFFHAGLRP